MINPSYRSNSQPDIHLPKIIPKLKIGPKTSISPPLSFSPLKSSISKLTTDIHKQAKPNQSREKTNFLDFLIQKYSTASQNESMDLVNKVQKIETILFDWSCKKTYGNIPGSRVGSTLTLMSNGLYLFGGQSGDRLNDLKLFNYEKLRWSTVVVNKDLEAPEPRDGHTALAYKHYLVVYGGAGSFNAILHSRTCSALLHLLDTTNLQWKIFKPLGRLPDPRRNHSASIVGNTMLIYGGINNNSEVLSDFQAVNLDLMQWFTIKFRKDSVRPGARHSFTMTSVYHPSISKFTSEIYNIPGIYDEEFTKKNTGIYIFGGMNAEGKVFNDLYLIQVIKKVSRTDKNLLKIQKIDAIGKAPLARYAHSAGLCGKYLVIVGGRNDTLYSNFHQSSINEIAALNITSCRWEIVETVGSLPPGFWGMASSSLGTKLLCFGGMNLNSFASNDLWVIETNQDPITKTIDKRRNGKRLADDKKKASLKMFL